MNDATVVDVRWYCAIENIGIVLIKTIGGHKAYIGTAQGIIEANDIAQILGRGSRFPNFDAVALWPHIEGWAS